MITLNPFGLKNNKLVSIHDVESGLKCNCVCVSCGSQLVAKKGNEIVHHFAHHNGDSCSNAIETALHLAAKDIILEYKRIMLPPLIEYDNYGNIAELKKARNIDFEEVRIEEFQKGFKPDVIGVYKGVELFIEIYVTHPVNEEKKERIISQGTSLIEIDLFDLTDGFTKKDLIKIVIEEIDNKEWIYHSQKKKLWKHFLEKETVNKEIIARKADTETINPLNQSRSTYLCKHLLLENIKKIKGEHKIIHALKDGASWNGQMYGKGENGKYIYLDGEMTFIFPPEDLTILSESEVKIQSKIYGQLLKIRRDSKDIYVISKKCPNFNSESFKCSCLPNCKLIDRFEEYKGFV